MFTTRKGPRNMANWDDNNTAEARFGVIEEFSSMSTEPETDQADIAEAADETEPDASAGEHKPQRRRSKSITITRSQALQVLETYRAMKVASDDARAVLRAVVRANESATDEELTAAVLSQDRADNPLATLNELREALAASPFTVPAIIAGMEKPKRNRAFSVLLAATCSDDVLPTKDVEAAALFTQQLSELTDTEVASLDEAHKLGR